MSGQSGGIFNTNSQSVSNGNSPSSPNVYSFTISLTGATVALDLKPLINNKRISNVQGILLDNSAGTTQCVVATYAGYNFKIPPAYEGMAPLYMSPDMVLYVTGNGTVNITLTNFSTPACVWPATSQALPVINNLVQTQDVALDALITNGALPSLGIVYGNTDVAQKKRGGKAYAGLITASGATTIITGNATCFVSGFALGLTGGATPTTLPWTAILGFSSSGTIYEIQLTAAVNAAGPVYVSMNDLNLIGVLGGENVTITLSSALTTGSLSYSVIGGTTSVN